MGTGIQMMRDENLEDEIKTIDESADFHAGCRDLLHWLVHALSLPPSLLSISLNLTPQKIIQSSVASKLASCKGIARRFRNVALICGF